MHAIVTEKLSAYAVEGKPYTFVCTGTPASSVAFYKDGVSIGVAQNQVDVCKFEGNTALYDLTCVSTVEIRLTINDVVRSTHNSVWYCADPTAVDPTIHHVTLEVYGKYILYIGFFLPDFLLEVDIVILLSPWRRHYG